ncbi:MAG: FIST C-terminal domain-containing protein [Bdellovibrionaceae bacterium]|nr:FIST C-terminal domain-containing protein [Bdellovibrionales bacterium]MCB9084027.1 FIST C-terminal domain-containing protein [Pseudobdellovibrionaceae bacterium]
MKVKSFGYQKGKGWSDKNPFEMEDHERNLILVFGVKDEDWARDAVKELAEHYPTSHIVGCSTSGEIQNAEVNDESLAVAMTHFQHTKLKTMRVNIKEYSSSVEAGKALVESLKAPDLSAVFILSDGLCVNGTQLLQGVSSVLDPKVVVTGGLAGDGDRFTSTYVLCPKGEICQDRVVAVGFYGDRVHVHHGSKGGWDIFGPERMVTKSEGNVLYELDHRPALELYKQYLGERAKELPASALLFPLNVRDPKDPETQYVRTILAIDEEKQSMTFAGDIPEGMTAQLMSANFDRLIDGAGEAASDITSLKQDLPTLSIAISCVGRRLVLGDRTEEEVEAVLEILPQGSHQVGFYSYGEISPLIEGRHCDLHNQTMTLTVIQEDEAA